MPARASGVKLRSWVRFAQVVNRNHPSQDRGYPSRVLVVGHTGQSGHIGGGEIHFVRGEHTQTFFGSHRLVAQTDIRLLLRKGLKPQAVEGVRERRAGPAISVAARTCFALVAAAACPELSRAASICFTRLLARSSWTLTHENLLGVTR